MNKTDILYEIYHKAGKSGFITMYELELTTGLGATAMRSMLEDLKAGLMIYEHPEGFQVSDEGMNYCKTKWI